MNTLLKPPRRRWLLALLIVLNIATLAAIWLTVIRKPFRGGPPADGAGGPEEVQSFLRRELGLSSDQAAAFDAIRDRFVEAARPTHEEIRKLKEEALAEMFKPEPDRAVLGALTSRIGVLRGDEERLLSLHFLDLMASLRPEQRPKFQSILREFMIRIGALEPDGPPGRPDRPDRRRGSPPPAPPR